MKIDLKDRYLFNVQYKIIWLSSAQVIRGDATPIGFQEKNKFLEIEITSKQVDYKFKKFCYLGKKCFLTKF